MSDLLNLGLSGLRTSRNNLSVTSHNISNLDTPGFSRQRAIQQTQNPMNSGNGYLGTGSKTQTVERLVDDYITRQVRVDTSRLNDSEAFLRNANELDNLLANDSTALGVGLENFFAGVQAVANDPLSAPARELMFSEGNSISNRFRIAQDRLDDQNSNINRQLNSYAEQVSSLAKSVASLNKEIQLYEGRAGHPPNDLLDRREERLRELSELIDIEVVHEGAMTNVFAGKGMTLVVGDQANTLVATAGQDSQDPSRHDVFLRDAKGNTRLVNESVVGGEMGGVMRYRQDTLDPALNEMGRMALVFAGEFNRQHQNGVDQNGDQGGDFFKDINSPEFMLDRIPRLQRNTPAGIWLDPERLDRLPAKEFSVHEDNGSFVLRSAPGGSRLESFADFAELNNHLHDHYGFRLTDASGNQGADGNPEAMNPALIPAEGLLLSPVRGGSAQLERSAELSDPRKLALGGISPDDNNTGQARFGYAELPAGVNYAGQELSVIPQGTEYNTARDNWASLELNEDGELVDDANLETYLNALLEQEVVADSVNHNAAAREVTFQVEVDGTNVTFRLDNIDFSARDFGAGDSWVMEGSAGAGNASILAGLQTRSLLDLAGDGTGGNSLGEAYSMLVEKTGIRTAEARTGTESARAVLKQTEAMRESLSGVNLDEEAANLMRFQQAYQASTQIISTAQRTFETLLNSMR